MCQAIVERLSNFFGQLSVDVFVIEKTSNVYLGCSVIYRNVPKKRTNQELFCFDNIQIEKYHINRKISHKNAVKTKKDRKISHKYEDKRY